MFSRRRGTAFRSTPVPPYVGSPAMNSIKIKARIFREGDIYTVLCPSLNVSSYGETIEEARQSIIEAVEAFIEECVAMGTLYDVIEESGFIMKNKVWQEKQFTKNICLWRFECVRTR